MQNKDFLVHTICLTYNHEPYVEDALKGFVMQQTTFPVVSVIIDDASTDYTLEILYRFMKDLLVLTRQMHLKLMDVFPYE